MIFYENVTCCGWRFVQVFKLASIYFCFIETKIRIIHHQRLLNEFGSRGYLTCIDLTLQDHVRQGKFGEDKMEMEMEMEMEMMMRWSTDCELFQIRPDLILS
jgi:hypothetical protein